MRDRQGQRRTLRRASPVGAGRRPNAGRTTLCCGRFWPRSTTHVCGNGLDRPESARRKASCSALASTAGRAERPREVLPRSRHAGAPSPGNGAAHSTRSRRCPPWKPSSSSVSNTLRPKRAECRRNAPALRAQNRLRASNTGNASTPLHVVSAASASDSTGSVSGRSGHNRLVRTHRHLRSWGYGIRLK